MYPYLRHNDVLWILEIQGLFSPKFGQLVFAERLMSGERIVHRHLAHGIVKGDRLKMSDSDLPKGIRILGIVNGRFAHNGMIHYSRFPISFFHRFQAIISEWNRWEHRGIHKIATGMLIVVGWIFRKFEDSWGIKNE